MSTKVSAWNLQEGLALQERSPHLVEAILRQDADVTMLSDAHWLDNPRHDAQEFIVEDALDCLEAEGYQATVVEYGEPTLATGHYLVGLSRLADTKADTVRLGGRNAISLTVPEPNADDGLRILGAHFKDRSELSRVAQAADATRELSVDKPVVLIGDLNALQGDSRVARFLGSQTVGCVARRIPHERARSIAMRMHEMGWGTTFRLLEAGGLIDADPTHQASFPARAPFMHLDRCFVSPEVAVRDFTVLPQSVYSDHRAIEVVIEA